MLEWQSVHRLRVVLKILKIPRKFRNVILQSNDEVFFPLEIKIIVHFWKPFYFFCNCLSLSFPLGCCSVTSQNISTENSITTLIKWCLKLPLHTYIHTYVIKKFLQIILKSIFFLLRNWDVSAYTKYTTLHCFLFNAQNRTSQMQKTS